MQNTKIGLKLCWTLQKTTILSSENFTEKNTKRYFTKHAGPEMPKKETMITCKMQI